MKKLVKALLMVTVVAGVALSNPMEAKAAYNEGTEYVVVSGDTLSEIADTHGTTVERLVELNPEIVNPSVIFPNQIIRFDESSESVVLPVVSNYTPVAGNEYDLLARLVHAEANGEPYVGKVAVARVVLNRVASGQFPDSIEGVIYQAGQFAPVTNGSINNAPTGEDYMAVDEALAGGGWVGNALYFYNARISDSAFHASIPTKAIIGNHTFK